jgi:hypothetical protein
MKSRIGSVSRVLCRWEKWGQCSYSIMKSIWTDLGPKLVLRGDRPATDGHSNDSALMS